MTAQLIPEWARAEAIILAWPHENTDWAPWLEAAQQTYINIIAHINAAGAGVILLHLEGQQSAIRNRLPEHANVLLVEAQYNDTWARDFGFLTCLSGDKHIPIEFTFNGWGEKFDASLDNRVNQNFLAPLCRYPMQSYPTVCEGGALEIDQYGHLLSTALCLTNPKRNGDKSLTSYAKIFEHALGAKKVTILHEGHLEGDDTDGHIDTLVRFTPHDGLVIQSCFNRPDDSHFHGLSRLVEECQQAFPNRAIFELPLPNIVNSTGDRLPASYANFLICNDAVLCPIYNQSEDKEALSIIAIAYPEHRVIGIDCSTIVQQYGSLHCLTMQVPANTLLPEIQSQLQKGITDYVG